MSIIPLIIRDFQFTRDFRQIKWLATIWYNLLRAASAGLVLGIFMFLYPHADDARTTALAAPFVWPFAYLFVFLPMGIVCAILKSFPIANQFSAFLAVLAVAIGDPLVCIIHKIQPRLVPVNAPPLFSLYLIFWVLDAPEISIAPRSISRN
jgi:hypothetical protein